LDGNEGKVDDEADAAALWEVDAGLSPSSMGILDVDATGADMLYIFLLYMNGKNQAKGDRSL
jgi:hypothetical protein